MVARAALTESIDGVPYEPRNGAMTITFSRKLANIRLANESYLDKLEKDGAGVVAKYATEIDPRQVTLIAFVRNKKTKRVSQAIQFTPKDDNESK